MRAKSGHHLAAVAVLREAGHGQGLVDHRLEITIRNVRYAGPAHQPGGEDIFLVGLGRSLDAVGGHQDGPGKVGEFLDLVLPGRSVVAVEVGVGLERGVAVGGQHFAVGVDGDPLAGGLLEQFFEILQIVARDQDGLARLVPQGHHGGDGMPIGPGVAGVEQFHGPQGGFATLERHGEPVLEAHVVALDGRQGLMDIGIDRLVLPAQDLGVVRVGTDALETEERGVLEGEDIGIGGRVGFEAHGLGLLHEPFQR